MRWLRPFATLLRALVWSPLRFDFARALAGVTAVALGIAVVIAIRLANRSALESFQTTARALAGNADLIVSGPAPIPASLLRRLRPFGAEAEIVPYVDRIALDRRADDTLELFASDWLAAAAGLPMASLASPATTAATSTEAAGEAPPIALAATYARRHGYHRGQSLVLVIGAAQRQFTIAALLPDRGIARAQQGNIALLGLAEWERLAAAAFAPGYPATFDGLQLSLAPGISAATITRQLRPLLPAGDTIEPPAARASDADKMLAAFHANLEALSYVALLVGAFLIYGAISVSVVRRREAIALVRAMGAGSRGVLGAFLVEAGALCAVGGLAGAAFGRLLAGSAVGLLSRTVNNIYTVNHPVPPRLDGGDWLMASGLALAIGLLASYGPARSAARIAPAIGLRRGEPELFFRLHRRRWAMAAIALALLAWICSRLPAVSSLPLAGYAAAFTAVLAAACAVPLLLPAVLEPARQRLLGRRHVAGGLAAASLLAAQRRTSVLVAALATAIAMLVGIAVMVGSFRQTVRVWLDETFEADVFIRALDGPAPLSPAVVRLTATTPGVAAADFAYAAPFRFRGQTVTLLTTWSSGRAAEFTAGAGTGLEFLQRPLPWRSPANTSGLPRTASSILVSEPFARRFRRWRGDWISLATPVGPERARIAGVFYDYSSSQGILRIDAGLYRRWFGAPPVTAIALRAAPGIAPAELRRRVARRLAAEPGIAISVHDNAGLKRQAMAVFDQTFRITDALELIALVIAMLGVANMLWAAALERRREWAVLWFLGFAPGDLRRLLFAEAAWIGALALGLGAALGAALAAILIFVVNVQSFGWTIQIHVPVVFLLVAGALIFAATLASAWGPARFTARLDPLEAIRLD